MYSSPKKRKDLSGSAIDKNLVDESKHNTFKAELPQIIASLASALSDTGVGMALAFSAVLIPQLLQEQANRTPNAIVISKEETTYIASLQILIVLPSSVINGFLMDAYGRTTVLKIGAIPAIVGWILVAISSNKWMLICGRTLCGAIAGMFTTSVLVYITEISTPNLRGALLVFEPAGVSLGMLMAYVIGACLHWRTFAWLCVGYTLIPLTVSMFLSESPPWLISKNRKDAARKSLQWLKRYHLQAEKVVEEELAVLIEEHLSKQNQSTQQKNWRMFLEPTVYKPLLIISGLFIIQQFTGSYVMLLYSVTFVKNVGTKVNPYIASIFIGGMRFAMSLGTIWLLRYYKRRNLLCIGMGGMAVCMGVSGLYTNWILEGTTEHNWVPVVMLPLYVLFGMMSVLSIPFTFTGEMFPIAARGASQSICFVVMNLVMFTVLESYFSLSNLFGGASGIQYFFGAVSLLGLVYCYVFVPETHRKKLSEIEDYFTQYSTYLSINPKIKHAVVESRELI